MSFVRSALTIGLFTLISRIFGFVRDICIARFIGANMLTDAFFVAFKLPNFMRRLFAEGAFNSAFVPLYAGTLAEKGEQEAKVFASQVMAVLMALLLALTALAEIFMPLLIQVLAPGFDDNPDKYELTVALTRITFPYIIFISLVSLLGGILNSHEKFAAVAATPILMNLAMIATLLLFRDKLETPAHALAWGVALAGIVQLAWLYYACKKLGILPRRVMPRITPQVKKLLYLIAPATLGAGVAQINLMIDMIIASHIPDGVSYLYYADRINELPLAVIGIAVGTALLPMLSKQLREGHYAGAISTQNRAIEFTLLFTLPATFALIMIAEPVIRVLFEHGAFTAIQTAATYPALMAFAAGLPSFVLIKVLAPTFFAHHDTKTPFLIASFCVVLNLILNLILIGPFQHVGMAMATSIAGWVNAGLMAVILIRRQHFAPDTQLLSRLPRMMMAVIVMQLVLLGVFNATANWHTHPNNIMNMTALALLIGAGLTAYGVAAYLLGAGDKEQLKKMLTRKRALTDSTATGK